MKDVFIKLCKWALGLLGVVALDSCDDSFITHTDEYGCPWSEYEIKGKVVDKETGEPLSDIKVEPLYVGEGGVSVTQIALPDTTGADGTFYFSNTGVMFFEEQIALKCTDLEASDGDYGEMEAVVQLSGKEDDNSKGSWYSGKFLFDATVEMTKKSE